MWGGPQRKDSLAKKEKKKKNPSRKRINIYIYIYVRIVNESWRRRRWQRKRIAIIYAAFPTRAAVSRRASSARQNRTPLEIGISKRPSCRRTTTVTTYNIIYYIIIIHTKTRWYYFTKFAAAVAVKREQDTFSPSLSLRYTPL